jgi:hypothetical protein
LQLIARHYRRQLGAALCFLRPDSQSFINHEPEARSKQAGVVTPGFC